MTEPRQWERELALFRGFIQEHPEIILMESEVSIPQNVRDTFYRHFDDVRKAVVEEHSCNLPLDPGPLSRAYALMESDVKELLAVEHIPMPVDLSAFLCNPQEGLMRVLYSGLFELLQGKISEEQFEERAGIEINAAARDLYRLGYERWASLVLIRGLDPDKAFAVELDEDFKPVLGELRELVFGRQAHHPTMRLPEFVLRLRSSGKYVAVKMALARELDTYVVRYKPMVKPKKKTGDTSYILDSRVMLLSFMDAAGAIPVYADIYECTLTSPDLLIEYVNGKDMVEAGSLDAVRKHLAEMKPRYGGRLVVVGDAPDTPALELPANARFIAAGLEPSKLLSILEGSPV